MFVVLGLGSNKSFDSKTPQELLSCAVRRLSGFIKNLEVSSVYRSAAMYVTDQEDFFNMVVSGYYSGTPHQLLDQIHLVEAEYGRDRSKEIRNGPRSLDIDIELFGNLKVNETDLIIPHERMCERAFVLKPLVEVLKKSADDNKADIVFYEEKLKKIKDQKIECLSARN
jgi:2-amino-4-hydroxy-6-hydroxymethyldihydropteridine diphosphokinase